MRIVDIISFARKEKKVLEAEILLSYFWDKPKTFFIMNSDFEIPDEILNKFNSAFEKVLKGYPVNYITNKKEFYGREFYVDCRVLIPRPETECLVEEVLKVVCDMRYLIGKERLAVSYQLSAIGQKVNVFDIGTGSGCIGITLALELIEKHEFTKENLKVVLSDISKDALEVAKENVERFKLRELCEMVEGDLLIECLQSPTPPSLPLSREEQIPPTPFHLKGEFKILVGNLPYIGEKTYNFIQDSVKEYEPNIALFSGDDGLNLYRKLIDQVAVMKADLACFEFGMGQEGEFEKIVKEKLPEYKYRFYEDLSGIVRGIILYAI